MTDERLTHNENFFRGLSLDNIYAKDRSSDQPALTRWTPHHLERQLLLRLVHAVSIPTGKPTILEAACGSGFVSSLLAADGHARIVGVDPNLANAGHPRLGKAPGDVQFETLDLWDVVGQFSPGYDSEVLAERVDLLNRVREYQKQNGPIYGHLHDNVQWGNPLALNAEVARLQELAKLSTTPSSVSLVLCSFMPLDIELTIPIRDGIYPVCMVYTRIPEGRGAVGAGDFYVDPKKTVCNFDVEEEAEVSEDSVISLNPGRNYRTIATWRTTQKNDWDSSSRRLDYLLGAEVVVQLRNDVVLNNVPIPELEKFGFDTEIEREIEMVRRRRAKRRDWVFEDRDLLTSVTQLHDSLFHD